MLDQEPDEHVIKHLTMAAEYKAFVRDLLHLTKDALSADFVFEEYWISRGCFDHSESHAQGNEAENLPSDVETAPKPCPFLRCGSSVKLKRHEGIPPDTLAQLSDLYRVLACERICVEEPELVEPFFHNWTDYQPLTASAGLVPSRDEPSDHILIAKE